jgi:hypothetical protein
MSLIKVLVTALCLLGAREATRVLCGAATYGRRFPTANLGSMVISKVLNMRCCAFTQYEVLEK